MSLDMVGSLCTDGAPTMLGNKSSFASFVKKGNSSHYSHTFYATLSRSCSQLIARKTEKCVINLSAVNYIKGNHRLFKAFCNKVGAKHSVLLYRTERRWLSRGRVLTHVFELRKEIEMFVRQRGSNLVVHFKRKILFCPWPTCQMYSPA